MFDTTIAALQSTLGGLSARRRVIADNIANVETPGYLAGRVEFESALSAALDDVRAGRSDRAAVGGVAGSRQVSVAPTRLNGNNVNLDDETVAMVETDLAYATAIEAVNAKFRLLRSAIREGA